MFFQDTFICTTWYNVFILLMLAHWLGDYSLQNDFVAQAKNPTTELGKSYWKHVLPAHSGIHAGLVFLITGFPTLFVLEFIVHGVTDYAKCKNKISFDTDQWIHIGCKVLWTIYFMEVHSTFYQVN